MIYIKNITNCSEYVRGLRMLYKFFNFIYISIYWRKTIMSLKEQVSELTNSVEDLKLAIKVETQEIALKIEALENKVAEFEGIDLSAEIEALKASVDAVSAISEAKPVVENPEVFAMKDGVVLGD